MNDVIKSDDVMSFDKSVRQKTRFKCSVSSKYTNTTNTSTIATTTTTITIYVTAAG